MTHFDPSRCDLCGHAEATTFSMPIARSMRSDQVIQDRPLVKRVCTRCGLAREGTSLTNLDAVYADEYAVAPGDYVFYTPTGPRSRGEVFATWFVDAFGASPWLSAKRVLEIGAGSGAVMAPLQRRFPQARFEGLELCRASATAARTAGHEVHAVDVHDWNAGPYDIIYAVAVLEHVPSPTKFLARLRDLLAPGGLLFLTQPTQNVASYDILFNDHLHHFHSDHLIGYANKLGFCERRSVVGHELMPNFSLHVWQKAESPKSWSWSQPPAESSVANSFSDLADSFTRCDCQISTWLRDGRTLGVFGLSEVFALARTYTCLANVPIRCGLDDDPTRSRSLSFPVMSPEESVAFGVNAVVVAANKVWWPQIERRLGRLGLDLCPVLR